MIKADFIFFSSTNIQSFIFHGNNSQAHPLKSKISFRTSDLQHYCKLNQMYM